MPTRTCQRHAKGPHILHAHPLALALVFTNALALIFANARPLALANARTRALALALAQSHNARRTCLVGPQGHPPPRCT
jgi:hypothetical protein